MFVWFYWRPMFFLCCAFVIIICTSPSSTTQTFLPFFLTQSAKIIYWIHAHVRLVRLKQKLSYVLYCRKRQSIIIIVIIIIVKRDTYFTLVGKYTLHDYDLPAHQRSRYSNHPTDQYSRREDLVATYYTAGCCSSFSLSLFAFLIVVFTLIELAHSMACTIYISKIKRHLVEKMSDPFPTSNKIKVLEEVSTGNYFINQS